jgi:hypothetical protein
MTERTPWKVIRSNVVKNSSVYSTIINCVVPKGTFSPQDKAAIARAAKTDGITNVSVEFFIKKNDDEVAIILYSNKKDAAIVAAQALVDAAYIEQNVAEEIRTKIDKAA